MGGESMASWYAKVIVSTLLILASGIGVAWIIRERLAPKCPVGAKAACIAVVAAALLLLCKVAGLSTALLFPGILVVAAFTGAMCSQPSPWSSSSILQALAVSAGSIVIVAVLTSNYSAAALALLASGVLVKLYADVSPEQVSSSRDAHSGAGAA
jgi:hypothetical protein